MPKFTVESGRQAGLRSVQIKKQRAIERELAPIALVETPLDADFLAADLACACVETLTELRKAKQPMHRAQLARALRDLRETWHLATGKPRPGLTRPDMVKPVRREIPRSVQPMFNANGHSQNPP